MRLSELVSNMSPSTFAESATVIFLIVFAAVAVWTFRRSQRPGQAEASLLPLADDVAPRAPGAQP